jgi:hypothetical protein
MGKLNVEFQAVTMRKVELKSLAAGEVFQLGNACYITTDEWLDSPHEDCRRCVDVTGSVGFIVHLRDWTEVIPVEASVVIKK